MAVKTAYYVELNGYSNFIVEKSAGDVMENFTITFACIPYTYETNISGILSIFAEREKRGIAIGVMKQGVVTVKIGLGKQIIEIESLKKPLKFQKSNIVTVAFWGTAGWCDLYVNGILSGRKQFPRHSSVIIVPGKYYVGKYVDGNHFLEQSRYGVFHGKLDFIEITDRYLKYEEVIRCHDVLYHDKQKQAEKETDRVPLYAGQDFSEDIYRPVFHLIPPGKWMNEPHAPFYYRGHYHIFYQANPHAPVWDNLCWGHLISQDMVSWKDVGIALYPDREGLDIDGCWSGSACLDWDGKPLLFYTAGNNNELPNQSVAIARPENTGDLELKNWIKQGVVLRQSIKEGFLGEFRDPFVWRKGETYYILMGTGDPENGGGNVLLYTSRDLQEFISHGFLVDYEYERSKEAGHVWELPVLLPLMDEGGYCCDILLLCACQVEKEAVETYYFLGKFDYEKNKFHKFHALPRLIDLGHGTFTGPSGFVTPDQRSVIFTIAQGRRNPEAEYHSGWAHNGGMPLQLCIKDDVLRISPINEVRKYFSKCVLSAEMEPECLGKAVLLKENLTENRILLSSRGNYLELILEWEADAYVVSYDRKTREWQTVSKSTGRRISKIRNAEDLVDIGAEAIEIECYIDHSMIELYLNQRKSMTLRSYPFCEQNRFYARTDGACSVSVWEYDALITCM